MTSIGQELTSGTTIGTRLAAGVDGSELYALAARIFPICRSITGNGVRQTLAQVIQHAPFQIVEVPSGTPVLDWTVPPEWNIRDAYIEDQAGRRVLDFRKNPLHVVSYSAPVHTRLPLAELKKHIHTLPAQPALIPYRTTYYEQHWGFCMAEEQLQALPDGIYTAVIDAAFSDGSLTYGELLHRGECNDEVLLSAHICHPALANDNCSGLAILAHLAARLAREKTQYSYRFLMAPGTIGALTWLARNENDAVRRIKHGLVLSCVGDGGNPTYKKSRRGTSAIDRVVSHVLSHHTANATFLDFSPYGYDERQYCSPGFNLPVGLLQRSRFGTYPEYHTSADNLDFITPQNLADSYRIVCATIDIIENDRRYLNLAPKGEPQLGRRGLYAALGGDPRAAEKNMAMLWVLNQSDGENSLLDIAERAGIPFGVVAATARLLEKHELLKMLPAPDPQVP